MSEEKMEFFSRALKKVGELFNSEPTERVLLTEYQVCQQAINGNIQSYWTLSGIFIGISSVLLGGLIYSLLSNQLNINTQIDINTIRTITTLMGIGVIIILIILRLWLARVNYLTDRSYERMREIEIDLGMWKNWRIKAIDTWNKQKFQYFDSLSSKNIDELWKKLRKELYKGISIKSRIKLDEVKSELINWCNMCNRDSRYRWFTGPSRVFHYNSVLIILSLLWLSTIIVAWII